MYEFVELRPPAWYHRQFLNSPPVHSGKLLDVGFGQGEFLNAAKRFDFDSYGIDIAERNVRMAKRHYGLENLEACPIGEFEERHPGALFDVVTAFEVLEHVPDPAGFVADVFAVLKSGGYFVMSTPNADRFGGTKEGWDYPPNHLFQWNAKTVTRLLEAKGFQVVKIALQPFTRDFFFTRGIFSFGFMRRLRARRVVVEKGVGPIAAVSASWEPGPLERAAACAGAGKNAVLRALLLPVEWAFRLCGVKYWDMYIVVQKP